VEAIFILVECVDSVRQAVKQWFYNNARKKDQKVTYMRKWSLRQVVGFVRKAEVQDLCKEQTGSNPGTKDYLAGYQKALAQVMEDMAPEDVEEYLKLATEWNKKSPPAELQRK
jgi:cation transport regulator ChaC